MTLLIRQPSSHLMRYQLSFGIIASIKDEELLLSLYELVHTSNVNSFFKKYFNIEGHYPVGIELSGTFVNEVASLTKTQFKRQIQIAMLLSVIQNYNKKYCSVCEYVVDNINKKGFFSNDIEELYYKYKEKIHFYFHQKIFYDSFICSHFITIEDLFNEIYQKLNVIYNNPFSKICIDESLIFKIGNLYKYYKKLDKEDVLDLEQQILKQYCKLFDVPMINLIDKIKYFELYENSNQLIEDNIDNYIFTVATKHRKLSILDWIQDEILYIFHQEEKIKINTKYSWNKNIVPSLKKTEILKFQQNAKPSVSKYGYVYIATNYLYNSDGNLLIKIGETSKLEERLNALSKNTSVPSPYVYLFIIGSKYYKKLERLTHKQFSCYRFNKDREFFTVNFETVINYLIKCQRKISEKL